MATNLDQLLNKLTTDYEISIAFFNSLPESIWEEQLYSDGAEWTVHEVLAHIVEVEGSLFHLFSNIAAGGKGVGPDFDVDRYNQTEVKKISSKTRQELLSLFSQRRTKMFELLQGFTPEILAKSGNHPYLGESKLEEMLRVYLLHVNLHIRDIRRHFGERLKSG